ncbi:scarecrow-like protein 11 isoform X1 [Corylus avellana]|uniref:scarecrow-like protein 11 isoform X1 n=1 Tax=Corylus avellana TaxID=13451 RepID=UPI00286B0B15|nr:scarecrow-like protein 11 isoform X1 [Corylus avellana]
MDTLLERFPRSMNKFTFDHGSVPLFSNDHNLVNRFDQVSDEFVNLPNVRPTNSRDSSDSSDPSDSGDFSNVFLKYINEMLMEEDLETKPCMLQDCLALQAAEKSFYEALVQESPPSSSSNQLHPGHFHQNTESPDCTSPAGSSSECTNRYAAPFKSLPNGNFEIIDLESIPSVPDPEKTRDVVAEAEKNRRDSSRGKKNHQRQDGDDQGRSNKQSVVYAGDPVPIDLFDKVLLLCPSEEDSSASCVSHESSGNGGGSSRKFQPNAKTTRSKKQGNKGEIVDLWTLLTQCAQAVASGDQRTANEQIKQIRRHSSSSGDGNQRLAHYVANALEARLAGTRVPVYTAHVSNGRSAADILKAYQVYVKACPFKRMSNFFANRTIRKLTLSQKASRIHIIDFGILYGYQWPCLIQRLSERPGGAPKLRLTGIELPQPGFRPAERVEETGRRLENYCKRFNVPFEFSVIAKKWETIQLEDLKIDGDELTVVNCLYRLKNLPDETMVANSPRDTVLKLIKRINPDLFVHGVVNGTYNAPFFATRFREALFHFSALFDMFDANVARDDRNRLNFEKEIYGRDVMNVVACEGLERVERPETYKQWQVRNLRAGFRQLPLDQDILHQVQKTVKSEYHKDFVVDVDGQWMLQGWKGRIVFGLSFWKPASKF